MAGTAVGRVRRAQLGVRFAVAGLVAGVGIAWIAARWIPASACDEAYRHRDYPLAVESCQKRYEHTHEVTPLWRAANAALQSGQLELAGKLAGKLQRTPRFADAHHILAYVAMMSEQFAAARYHAGVAFLVHELAGGERDIARDAALLSEVALEDGDYRQAIAAADDAIRRFRDLGDRDGKARTVAIRAMALRRVGDVPRAIDELRAAYEATTSACERARIQFELTLAYEESPDALGHAGLALADAARYQARCPSALDTDTLRFHQAWVVRASAPAEARTRVDALLASHPKDLEVWLLSGYLHANAGALAAASEDLARAEAIEPPDADWPWVIAEARAELAEQSGGVLGPLLAELHYRRAIAMVEVLRTTAQGRSAYLVASHRGPYDGLIALLARQGRWRDVLAEVLALDASDMLRATASARSRREGPALDLLAQGPAAAATRPPSVDAVLAAWRSRDLVIAFAASEREIGGGHERAYRLRIRDGEVTGEDVGAAAEARALAEQLARAPDDRLAGRALGAMLIPGDRARDTLDVLAIGELGRAPLAALRDADGARVLARRPLARVLGLVARGDASRGGGGALVIADPTHDLPWAVIEGAAVAAAAGSGARLAGGSAALPADRAALWTARGADLLHVAAHVGEVGRWRALVLADGPVEPAEMLQRGLAPRLAVLASCGSAALYDAEGWGSIAAALLTAGTATVIATDRTVDDAAALSMMLGFYAAPDWRSDPARALARVQVALDARTAADSMARQTWAAFSVLERPPVVAPRP